MMYRTNEKCIIHFFLINIFSMWYYCTIILIVVLQVKILIKPKNNSRINEAKGGSFK